MSSTDRQNRLLVAEDWKKIYQTFRNADFQSYDFENLRRTMISYIRQNYPEDYNDYIESSEYLALIDLIAFLGQSIAFRVDLNARENFLELAERRESVLRLARMLSYNAKRNVAASGLLKFTNIQTSQTVLDSNGRNLAGQVITWNDPANPNWYDQFIRVINAALPQTRQFGNPDDKASIYGIPTEQYRVNGANTNIPIFAFNKTVEGQGMSFEVVSTVFSGEDYIYEEPPKVGNKLAFIYRDDGKGAASGASGFFLQFKQGTLNTGSFTITQPSNNESVDIDAVNINNDDVWLYKLDQNGSETSLWNQVPSFEGNNIIYNSLKKSIRNIYGAVTRAGDRISLVFSDGTFGDLPLGTFRAYYRVSNGFAYTINPRDLRGITISLPYYSNKGQLESLTITLGLQSSVANASPTETNTSIKNNAPATYYTQNRMITGEDYNISPLSVSQEVLKVKAVNRTSSGISRYFDLVDPTGKYSSTNLFSDDGILYQEEFTDSIRFSYANKTDIEGIIYNKIFDILAKPSLRNYYYNKFVKVTTSSLNISWYNATSDTGVSTGFIGDAYDRTVYKVGAYTANDLKYVEVGSLVKFVAPDGYYFNTKDNNAIVAAPVGAIPLGYKTYLWAEVISISGDGTANGTGLLSTGYGPIALNDIVQEGSLISKIIPKWRTVIDSSVITTMIDLIFANKPFGLRYDTSSKSWQIIFESNLDSFNSFTLGKQGDISNQQLDSSWLLLFTTDNEFYTVTSRELQYIFESDANIRFYFDKSHKIYNSKTNTLVKDNVKLLSINTVPDSTTAFTYDLNWDVVSEYVGLDGYVDTKKILITFADSNDNGVVDDPDQFTNVVQPTVNPLSKYVVLQRYTIEAGQEDYKYVSNDPLTGSVIILTAESEIQDFSQYSDGQYFYFTSTGIVKKFTASTTTLTSSLAYKVFVGRDNLKFQYIHSADYESRIDPGSSNIVDIFILSRSYDTKYRQWIAGSILTEPLPPSSDELYNIVSSSLNQIKSISDEIIYHPVKYKALFGANAPADVQATFKVIKNASQVISDNDVKSKVLRAINQFFILENWDFGDTFYFSELSTYVMNQLAPNITNFVIVPKQSNLTFGSLYEIKASSDELFINAATVDDIEIISGITASAIKTTTATALVSNAIGQQTITSR
jgi:hypothetical protein